jgi:hypothetical protein
MACAGARITTVAARALDLPCRTAFSGGLLFAAHPATCWIASAIREVGREERKQTLGGSGCDRPVTSGDACVRSAGHAGIETAPGCHAIHVPAARLVRHRSARPRERGSARSRRTLISVLLAARTPQVYPGTAGSWPARVGASPLCPRTATQCHRGSTDATTVTSKASRQRRSEDVTRPCPPAPGQAR